MYHRTMHTPCKRQTMLVIRQPAFPCFDFYQPNPHYFSFNFNFLMVWWRNLLVHSFCEGFCIPSLLALLPSFSGSPTTCPQPIKYIQPTYYMPNFMNFTVPLSKHPCIHYPESDPLKVVSLLPLLAYLHNAAGCTQTSALCMNTTTLPLLFEATCCLSKSVCGVTWLSMV